MYSGQEVRQVRRKACKLVAGLVIIDVDLRIAEDVYAVGEGFGIPRFGRAAGISRS